MAAPRLMFSELTYYLFLAVAVVAYHALGRRGRTAVLAASGLAFYAYYAGAAVFLLLFLTVGSWALLFAFAPEKTGGSRLRGAAITTIVASVAVLAVVKYGPFLLGALGAQEGRWFAVPLAISFFTFEFVHVAAERWRGTIDRIPFLRYLAFIFFFPTMIAGPIKRYGDFEPCLDEGRLTARDLAEGLFRILLGLFKKAVIADNLTTLIDEIGRPVAGKNPVFLALAVLLYGFRIVLDFAGYSDIAIGSARLFGIRVPENFLYPYRQTNIAQFWRHWHISLSSWLTDYVYIPLGGSRRGEARQLLNLFVVMLVSGLWHVAAWNFVLWGAWHGALLVGHRLHTIHLAPRLPESLRAGRVGKAGAYALTMACVWFGWMLFMWPIADVRTFFALLLHRGAA